MKSVGIYLVYITVLFSWPALAWQIPAGLEFPNEEQFTQHLALKLDCDLVPGSRPIPVDAGIGVPWAGHSYHQLKDGSWMAKGAMLCHDPVGNGRQPKLYVYNWSVGFELSRNRSIKTNGRNTKAYQGYDYGNLPEY